MREENGVMVEDELTSMMLMFLSYGAEKVNNNGRRSYYRLPQHQFLKNKNMNIYRESESLKKDWMLENKMTKKDINILT